MVGKSPHWGDSTSKWPFHGLFMGLILTTYKSWDDPPRYPPHPGCNRGKWVGRADRSYTLLTWLNQGKPWKILSRSFVNSNLSGTTSKKNTPTNLTESYNFQNKKQKTLPVAFLKSEWKLGSTNTTLQCVAHIYHSTHIGCHWSIPEATGWSQPTLKDLTILM